MNSVITKTESDTTSQPTACDDILRDSNAEEASASTEIQSTSLPAAINDKDQGSSKVFTDLDYLDGPTVITEVCPLFHMCVSYSLGYCSRSSRMRLRTTVRRP